MTHPKPSNAVTVPATRQRHRLRSREWPRPPRKDPHTRVIAQLLDLAGTDSSVIATSSRPWASATFVGARHVVVLRLKGPDNAARAATLADRLPDAEFSITGHIVADACADELRPAADGSETVMRLSILTIEDW